MGQRSDPELANYDDTGIGTTSAAGCFARGASAYGCRDLSGNVLEWTRSLYGRYELKEGNYTGKLEHPYPYQPEDGREELSADRRVTRVLRGGSFYYDQRIARCACRNWHYPGIWDDDVGFRVVVSPFSS